MKRKPDKIPSPRAVAISPFAAIPFLLVRPKLLGILIIPVILNFMVLLLAVWLGWELLAGPLVEGIESDIGWLQNSARAIVGAFLFLANLIVAAIIAYALIIPIGSPFYDYVGQKIEEEKLADRPDLIAPPQSIAQGIRHSIYEGVRRAVFQLPIVVTIFIIGFTPVAGPAISAILGLSVAIYFLPLDAYSYSLDRRGMTLKEKLAFLRAHKSIWLPLGVGLSIMFLIPCTIFWFPPLAAVAATRLYCSAVLLDNPKKPDAVIRFDKNDLIKD